MDNKNKPRPVFELITSINDEWDQAISDSIDRINAADMFNIQLEEAINNNWDEIQRTKNNTAGYIRISKKISYQIERLNRRHDRNRSVVLRMKKIY